MMKHIVESSDGNGITDKEEMGASASQTGPSQAEPVVSAVPASVPCGMTIIARREIIQGVAEAWRKQYGAGYYAHDHDKQRIQRVLDALDLSACHRSDVDRAIGNASWTSQSCDLCGEDVEIILRLGEEPDYDARWQDICLPCAAKIGAVAAQAIEAGTGETERLDPKGESAVHDSECAQPSGDQQ